MAKGHWIGHITVKNPDAYERYKAANAAAFARFGGRFIVRGGRFQCLVGHAREHHVVIEFDSYDAALACYNSPEYREAQKLQTESSENDIIVIEGV
ncbi:DUF1330 domain-containing protein [Defluviimonas sp. WL0002]|uniref:DUF1330 domain-containing protein n=1 Tax=Albidovulum marisflavi TaxID=2984159 RepID=A0ABT2ZA06_9RHOB|nr:DUF1330 domain-containing protein [Defluviimonas sp. WL0002]MCV2867969.1 DUF1330 domain-containing protein [Defluviimonas sp. WL0002]